MGIIGEIANITMGQSPNGNSYNEEKNGTVFYQGRAEFGWRFPTQRLFTTEPKRMANIDDVLMSVRAPVGDINIAHENCCIGRGLAAIQSKSQCQSFVLYTMMNLKQHLNIFNGEGTVFGSINKDDLNNMKIIIPDISIMKDFQNTINSIDSQIKLFCKENYTLQEIRDTLLPKLMSGKVRIPHPFGISPS